MTDPWAWKQPKIYLRSQRSKCSKLPCGCYQRRLCFTSSSVLYNSIAECWDACWNNLDFYRAVQSCLAHTHGLPRPSSSADLTDTLQSSVQLNCNKTGQGGTYLFYYLLCLRSFKPTSCVGKLSIELCGFGWKSDGIEPLLLKLFLCTIGWKDSLVRRQGSRQQASADREALVPVLENEQYLLVMGGL